MTGSSGKVYRVPAGFGQRAHVDRSGYERLYQRSLTDSDAFWAEQAEQFLDWSGKWDRVQEWDYHKAQIKWFINARLNVCHNCLDRHLPERAAQTALLWEGDTPGNSCHISYQALHERVCRLANVLLGRGVSKGDRVAIYMPMVPEAVVAMLACARIGAVHSVVFGGFSPESLRERILDCGCVAVITSDEGVRGGRTILFKANVDQALQGCPDVHTAVVVRVTGQSVAWQEPRDIWYQQAVESVSADCPAQPMDAEDPLFILYTSGSTGKPKGVLHSSAGYLLYAAMTHKYIFDYQDGEVYWCTADVGWITGHSYIVYGPLCNGATTVVYEGVPTWPDAGRFWQVVQTHRINSLYTAPTIIRTLMRLGDEHVFRHDRSSLRILGSVGEPINPEAWEWFHRVVGERRCPLMDTWWQTETGGALITPLPGATDLKPGSATLPFFGVEPALLDEQGREIEGTGSGYLVMKRSWPGQMRTIYGAHARFVETYFTRFPGYYLSGDGAERDADGYYWLTGRIDDVLNVSGHRMGTAEIERALTNHTAVAEAAVVGFPHSIKGEGIYAYVTLKQGYTGDQELHDALVARLRSDIGAIARPDHIHWAAALPKTRSGKIMRRILRKIAAGQIEDLGDTSTLADPAAVTELIKNRQSTA